MMTPVLICILISVWMPFLAYWYGAYKTGDLKTDVGLFAWNMMSIAAITTTSQCIVFWLAKS